MTESTIRVVIAEDEAIVRLDLKEILTEEGFQVVGETGRGDEVVALVRDTRPDIAILDVKMPGGDGIAAAKAITDEKLAPVLVLTAFSQRDLIEDAREAGALAYLVKPYERSELLPAIEVAIGRYKEQQAIDSEAHDAEQRVDLRKAIDQAKGKLMDDNGLSERDAFDFIATTASSKAMSLRDVASGVLDGTLAP